MWCKIILSDNSHCIFTAIYGSTFELSAGKAMIENLFSSFLAAEVIEGPHNQLPADTDRFSEGSAGHGGGEDPTAVGATSRVPKGTRKGKVTLAPKKKKVGVAKARAPRKAAAKKGGSTRKGGKRL